jgi:ribonuclease P protein subunit POP4
MTSSPRTPTTTTISHPAHDLLSRAHSPDTAARIFTDKVKNKPLLLQPTAASDQRALRRHLRLRKKEYFLRKRKPRPLSAKEKRQLGVFKLKKEEVKYEIYKGLHEMWKGYMLEVLGYMRDGEVVESGGPKEATAQSHGGLLASADFHGAELEVARSTDVGKVGIKGIVVRDTKFTFVVITTKDEVKTIPKHDTVFRYEIPLPSKDDQNSRKLVFELHGSQFELRPAERANRKFKWRSMDYL